VGVGDADAVRAVFRGERRVSVQTRADEPERTRSRSRKGREASAISPTDRPLFEALRAWRRGEAQDQHVPPYVIFNDRTLTEIAATKPVSRAALAQVNGVGEGKLARYGEAVMQVVRGFS
jgi:ATP-dependent DNA helicase RecQ